MGQDRKRKLKRREQQRVRAQKKRIDYFNTALARAGLTDAFRRLNMPLQVRLRRCVLPEPQVVIDTSAIGFAEAVEIRRRFHELLREPSPYCESELTPREWLAVISGLKMRIEALETHLRESGRGEQEVPWCDIFTLGAAIRAFAAHEGKRLFSGFLVLFLEELLKRSRIDEKIFWYRVNFVEAPGAKWTTQVALHCSKPTRMQIPVDGKPRPAFRCTLFFDPSGAKELSWPVRQFGVIGGPDELPVYMQTHVLKQLQRRIPFANACSVTLSLRVPKFHRQHDGSILVEYFCAEQKLGYFVAVLLGDKVLLKTFLFLTMQGTPESDLLYHRLRLTRSDIEYLHLDELSFFSSPDVRNDPYLQRLFEECGCGHLLKIDLEEFSQQSNRGDAETLKKYLGEVDLVPRARARAAR